MLGDAALPPRMRKSCMGVTCPLLPFRDVEYKELQLSLDQVSTSKSQESWRTTLSTSQETRKSAKPKNTKMKTKLRTNPYPPQVTRTQGKIASLWGLRTPGHEL